MADDPQKTGRPYGARTKDVSFKSLVDPGFLDYYALMDLNRRRGVQRAAELPEAYAEALLAGEDVPGDSPSGGDTAATDPPTWFKRRSDDIAGRREVREARLARQSVDVPVDDVAVDEVAVDEVPSAAASVDVAASVAEAPVVEVAVEAELEPEPEVGLSEADAPPGWGDFPVSPVKQPDEPVRPAVPTWDFDGPATTDATADAATRSPTLQPSDNSRGALSVPTWDFDLGPTPDVPAMVERPIADAPAWDLESVTADSPVPVAATTDQTMETPAPTWDLGVEVEIDASTDPVDVADVVVETVETVATVEVVEEAPATAEVRRPPYQAIVSSVQLPERLPKRRDRREEIVARLREGPASANELAEFFEITREGVLRWLRLLEEDGVIRSTAVARTSRTNKWVLVGGPGDEPEIADQSGGDD